MADAQTLFVLLESAAGYGLFEVVEYEEIGNLVAAQESITDLALFGRAVKLAAFYPFSSAAEALDNANAVSEHACSDTLRNFLEMNLPKSKSSKKSKVAEFALGVIDPALATAISEALSVTCRADDSVREILRGCRLHLERFVKGLDGNNAAVKAQLGLGHSYSRSKVKFNPARSDNMIIQSIALLDQLDKDINTFAMRIREWYSWHFPELKDLVPDNILFARAAAFIQDKNTLVESEEKLAGLTECVGDPNVAEQIVHAAKTSMGMDCSPTDMLNIVNFTQRMVNLAEYRRQLSNYLSSKMNIVAPNLSTLLGDAVAARLISKAGSLTNLAKAPASTVQILGAEKALFRALKTKGNTPKYGLIYHSTFIGRADAKNKGRISRYLANKCSIATRIDSFTDEPTNLYGQKLREQVEERLKFYETGAAPRRNVDVMEEVAKELGKSAPQKGAVVSKKGEEAEDVEMKTSTPSTDKKKKKKDKKRKSEDIHESEGSDAEAAAAEDDKAARKSAKKAKKEKKKKKKSM